MYNLATKHGVDGDLLKAHKHQKQTLV